MNRRYLVPFLSSFCFLAGSSLTTSWSQERFWLGESRKGDSWERAKNWDETNGPEVPSQGDVRIHFADLVLASAHRTANYTLSSTPRTYNQMAITSGGGFDQEMTFRKSDEATVTFNNLVLRGFPGTSSDAPVHMLMEEKGFAAGFSTLYGPVRFDVDSALIGNDAVDLGSVTLLGSVGNASLLKEGGGELTALAIDLIAGEGGNPPTSTYPNAILRLAGGSVTSDAIHLHGIHASAGWNGVPAAGLDLEQFLSTPLVSAEGGTTIATAYGERADLGQLLVGGAGSSVATRLLSYGAGTLQIDSGDIQGGPGGGAEMLHDNGALISTGPWSIGSGGTLTIHGGLGAAPGNYSDFGSLELSGDSSLRLQGVHSRVRGELSFAANGTQYLELGNATGSGTLEAGSVTIEGGVLLQPDFFNSASTWGSSGPYSAHRDGDYRSKSSGNWGDLATWEQYSAATASFADLSMNDPIPGYQDRVLVQKTHQVFIDDAYSVGTLIIENSDENLDPNAPNAPGEVVFSSPVGAYHFLTVHEALDMKTAAATTPARIIFADVVAGVLPKLVAATNLTLAGEVIVMGDRGGEIQTLNASDFISVAPGAILAATGGDLCVRGELEMDGTLRVDGPFVAEIASPLRPGSAGNFEVTAAGGVLRFAGNSAYSIDNPSGHILVAAGSLQVIQSLTYAGGLQHRGGTISVASGANLSVSGRYRP
jgi:hypothetical protein